MYDDSICVNHCSHGYEFGFDSATGVLLMSTDVMNVRMLSS